jgi:hypothetical protein
MTKINKIRKIIKMFFIPIIKMKKIKIIILRFIFKTIAFFNRVRLM